MEDDTSRHDDGEDYGDGDDDDVADEDEVLSYVTWTRQFLHHLSPLTTSCIVSQ